MFLLDDPSQSDSYRTHVVSYLSSSHSPEHINQIPKVNTTKQRQFVLVQQSRVDFNLEKTVLEIKWL